MQVRRSSPVSRTGSSPSASSTVIARSVSSASGRQNAVRSATTATASQVTRPVLTGLLAARMTSSTVRSSASTSPSIWVRSAWSYSDSASIRSAVIGVRSRWDTSAIVSRS